MQKRWPKYLSFLLLIILFAYVIASWYIGKTAQQRVYDLIDRINQQSIGQWVDGTQPPHIEISSYERGVFDSKISYKLIFPEGDTTKVVSLSDNLSHGPFPVNAVVTGFYKPVLAYSQIEPINEGEFSAWFALIDNNKAPWQLNTYLDFNGDTASTLLFEPITNTDKQIDFSGGTVAINYQQAQERLKIKGEAASLSYFDTSLSAQNQLNNIGLTLDSYKNNKLLNTEASLSVAEFLFKEANLGSINIVFAIENMDADAFQEFSALLNKFSHSYPFLTAEQNQELQDKAALAFASSPKLALKDFHWETASGKSEVNLELLFKPIEPHTTKDLGSYIEQSIDHVNVYLGLSKPMLLDVLKPTLDERSLQWFSMLYDRYVADLQRKRLVVIDGAITSTNLRYTQGRLDINGKDSDYSDLYGLLSLIFSP